VDDENGSTIHKWIFDLNVKYNFIQHCFCDLGSHFEALKSVLPIFFLGFASKKYDQTDSRAPKSLPRVIKTVMYIVKYGSVLPPSGNNWAAIVG
jgi:hypothetical protein